MNAEDTQVSEHKWLFNFDRPWYEPPYGSAIEDFLAWDLVKYLSDGVAFRKQHEVKTFCCSFYLDFYVAKGDQRIGIECDGRDYHNDDARDRVRDTLILGTGEVDTIFRIKGKNIFNNLPDCLYVLAKFCPSLFSERAHINLETLAHRTTQVTEIDIQKPFIEIRHPINADEEDGDYLDEEEKERPWSLFLEARSFRETNYYFFMFRTFWDIIRINEWKYMNNMVEAFQDIPALVDKHFAKLRSLSHAEHQLYMARLKSIQERLDALVKEESTTVPDLDR